jgi:protein gp37
MTNISWTQETWNPIVGCSLVSPGCTNCYAMQMAHRLEKIGTLPHYQGTTKVANGHPVWAGKIAMAPESILISPLKRKKPTTYFVNSMSDLFHEDVPEEWIDRVFAVMALCPQHTFQVLTKRSKRMLNYLSHSHEEDTDLVERVAAAGARMMESGDQVHDYLCNIEWPLLNAWLGVSCEDQKRADERIPDLLATPAAHRFVSAEPLIGRISFGYMKSPYDRHADVPGTYDPLGGSWWPAVGNAEEEYQGREEGLDKIDLVITGGESGPNRRPMDMAWAEDIMRQCKSAETMFHFKQDSAAKPGQRGRASDELWACKDVPGVRS